MYFEKIYPCMAAAAMGWRKGIMSLQTTWKRSAIRYFWGSFGGKRELKECKWTKKNLKESWEASKHTKKDFYNLHKFVRKLLQILYKNYIVQCTINCTETGNKCRNINISISYSWICKILFFFNCPISTFIQLEVGLL